MITGHAYHDDLQGIVGHATGVSDLGVLYVDAHFPTDRYGSYNEYAD